MVEGFASGRAYRVSMIPEKSKSYGTVRKVPGGIWISSTLCIRTPDQSVFPIIYWKTSMAMAWCFSN